MKKPIVAAAFVFIIFSIVFSSNSGLANEEALDVTKIPDASFAATSSDPFGKPADYDSGWTDIGAGADIVFAHNLGGNPDNYVVDLQAYNILGGSHQYYYGGDSSYWTDHQEDLGFYWYGLDGTNIKVKRYTNDFTAIQVRVRIWVVPSADYDSGWETISKASLLVKDHNLGGNPDEYIVDLQFKNLGGLGTNNCGYGTDTYYKGGTVLTEKGAAWRNLTDKNVILFRLEDDECADQIRVRIWKVTRADYDSGSQKIDNGNSKTLIHDLGGPWNDFVVDMQFRDNVSKGVPRYLFGGNEINVGATYHILGAWLDTLDNNQITVTRGFDDTDVDEVRVRIWANPAPKYDSGWKSIAKGEFMTIPQNLGGDPDHYVVDLQFKETNADGSSGRGVSHKNYGGDTYKIYPSGKMEYHGANWWGLTNSEIKIRRQMDDMRADEVRVRIWIAPVPSFDSRWTPILADELGDVLNHTIGGDRDEYVVDMQFKDTSASGLGVNQQDYGWNDYKSSSLSSVWTGVAWSGLDNASIRMVRGLQDTAAEQVRIRIWKNPKPDYDSNWKTFNNSLVLDLIHKLGGNPDNYVIDLQFLDEAIHGIHQIYYGRNNNYLPDGTALKNGAFWYGLNSSQVKIQREIDEVFAEKVRIRIWVTGYTPTNYIYLPAIIRSN